MKKLKYVIIGFVVVVCLFLLNTMLFGVPSVYGPTTIPFPYDPNLVAVSPVTLGPKLLGGVDVRAGQEAVVGISCKDDDGDPFSIRILNWKTGMNLTVSNDPNSPSELKWTPTNEQAGLHYVNVESWDFPPDPNDSLTDRATIVFLVRPRNRPPVLLPWSD